LVQGNDKLLRNIKDFEVELAKLRTAYNNGNGTITKEEYQKQKAEKLKVMVFEKLDLA
jgi:uncharacterized membrane protein YgaE (UPF0421/DUF939 family)